MKTGRGNSSGERRYCTLESLAADDPLAGTAAHPERTLLLSWPRRKWAALTQEAIDMPPAVTTALEAIAEAGRRVNLIHRRDQAAEPHRLLLFPERVELRVPRDHLPRAFDDVLAGRTLDAWHPRQVKRPVVLCCTHGRKDRCCAKFGHAGYRALAAAAARRGNDFDVWESTHLGGCRFAPGALLLPAMRKYGRIDPNDAEHLLQAESEGRPWLTGYRGHTQLDPAAQCAEVAALRWLAERGLIARVTVTGPRPLEAGAERRELEVHWQAPRGQGVLRVTAARAPVVRADTCADLDAVGCGVHWAWRAVACSSVSNATAWSG